MNEEPALQPESPTVGVHASACPVEQLDPPPIIPLPSDPSATSSAVALAKGEALMTQNSAVASATNTINTITTPFQRGEGKRTRNGKIARLPKDLREMVNRLLRNNIPYSRIVRALHEYDVVVTERNISNWKICGGYKEWCLAEEHALELRLHQDNLVNLLRKDNASEVPEVGLQVAATRLSQFFLTPEADQLLASNPDEYHRRAAHLTRLTAEIHKLQKYRDDCARALGYKHNPDMLRSDNEEEIERAVKCYSSRHPEDIKLPSIPHRNYIPKG